MPNRVRPLKRTDRLTARQKTLVKKIRSRGLKPVVYRRKGNRNRLSVHNPFLDAQRKAKVPKYRPIKANWTPQAFDSKKQRSYKKKTVRKAVASKKKVKKGGLFEKILFP